NDNPLSEILKVGASIFTFIFFSLAVRTRKDFRRIATGFVAVAVVIGIFGFFASEEVDAGGQLSGINVLEGIGNKNAQSLFTLPGLFLAIFLGMYYFRRKKYLLAAGILACIFFIVVQIFLSANRSGWIGMFTIFLSFLVTSGVNIRALVISFFLLVFTYIAIDRYAADVVERKRVQTVEGYASDVGRQMLIRESLLIGLENPIFGIGFEPLFRELAKRLDLNKYGREEVDTHFLFGYIIGATGIISLSFFLLFLRMLCKRRIKWRLSPKGLKEAWLMVATFV